MQNTINCGSCFHERIVLKNDAGEMLAYVPERTCRIVPLDGTDELGVCTECACEFSYYSGWNPWEQRYTYDCCPCCGARVVE